MKKMVKIVLAMLICCGIAAPTFAAPSYEDGDWQFWNTESFKGTINDKIGVYGEQEFRWGDGMSQYYYEHSQIQLDFKALDWLTISPAFREIYEMNKKGVWYPEHSPQLDLTGKWKIFADWTFENRARFQYRIFDEPDKEDAFRFRNKFTLKSPWKWTPLKINPYIADEIFLQEDKDGIYRNRFSVGVGMQFFKNVKGDIFYMWQAEDKGASSDPQWWSTNILGAKLKCEF